MDDIAAIMRFKPATHLGKLIAIALLDGPLTVYELLAKLGYNSGLGTPYRKSIQRCVEPWIDRGFIAKFPAETHNGATHYMLTAKFREALHS